MWVQSLGWENPLEKGMATHTSIPAWRVPWTEKPGKLQSRGLQEADHDWSNSACTTYHLGHCGLLWCSKESPGEPHFGMRASTQKTELPILFHGPKPVLWLHLTSSSQRCAVPPGARRRVSSMDVDYIYCQQESPGPGRPSGMMDEGFEL